MLRKVLRAVGTAFRFAMIVLLLISVLVVSVFVYDQFFVVTEVCSIPSADQHYTIGLYQIGSPSWPFGPVKARLTVKNPGGGIIDQCTFQLNNDGGGVYDNNIQDILWYPDRVEVVMRGADDRENTTYTLLLD